MSLTKKSQWKEHKQLMSPNKRLRKTKMQLNIAKQWHVWVENNINIVIVKVS